MRLPKNDRATAAFKIFDRGQENTIFSLAYIYERNKCKNGSLLRQFLRHCEGESSDSILNCC